MCYYRILAIKQRYICYINRSRKKEDTLTSHLHRSTLQQTIPQSYPDQPVMQDGTVPYSPTMIRRDN